MVAMAHQPSPQNVQGGAAPVVPAWLKRAKALPVAVAAKDLPAVDAQASVLQLLQAKAQEMQVDLKESGVGKAWMHGLLMLAKKQHHMRRARSMVALSTSTNTNGAEVREGAAMVGSKRAADEPSAKKPKRQRYVWSQELHACFCKAVNLLGIEQARPQAIRKAMIEQLGFTGPNMPTRMTVKSHLQKYRIYLDSRSKELVGDAAAAGQMPLDLVWSLENEDIEEAINTSFADFGTSDLAGFGMFTMGQSTNVLDDVLDPPYAAEMAPSSARWH